MRDLPNKGAKLVVNSSGSRRRFLHSGSIMLHSLFSGGAVD